MKSIPKAKKAPVETEVLDLVFRLRLGEQQEEFTKRTNTLIRHYGERTEAGLDQETLIRLLALFHATVEELDHEKFMLMELHRRNKKSLAKGPATRASKSIARHEAVHEFIKQILFTPNMEKKGNKTLLKMAMSVMRDLPAFQDGRKYWTESQMKKVVNKAAADIRGRRLVQTPLTPKSK